MKRLRLVTAAAAIPASVGLVLALDRAENCHDRGLLWYVLATAVAVVAICAVAAFSFAPRRWHWGVRLVPAAILGGAACFAVYVLLVWAWVVECSN